MNSKVKFVSKALGPNPKDILGAAKISLSKLPAVAELHGNHAMMNGADKYGAYNWRGKKVVATIYIDALKRHANAWLEGQETATDSGVHHLGHAIACAAILLDAQETGNLIDDRPIFDDPDLFDRVLGRLNKVLAATRAKNGAVKPVTNEKEFPHPHKLVKYKNGKRSSRSRIPRKHHGAASTRRKRAT